MNPLSQPVCWRTGVTTLSGVLLLALCGCLAAGCSSGGMLTVVPPPPTPTSVTMVVSSTANDQFASFYVAINGISLTSQTGTVVNVLAAPQNNAFSQIQEAEFIHLNG
jgi:hypothetical protein